MDSPLAKLFQACDPMLPATSEQYVECSAVRGGHAFTERFCGALRNSGTNGSFLRFLVTGHVGGGKSSELVHLRAELERMEKPYLVVMMDAKEYIDDNDVTPNDILLAVISELAATVKEKTGVELKDSYLTRKLNEWIGFLRREVDVDAVEIPFSGAKTQIKLLKLNEVARAQVRDALLPIESTFLTQVNLVFEEARQVGKKNGFQDIVLILDNLEKIQRVDGAVEGSESHRELFIIKAPKFIGISCNFVLTVPLSLVRTHAGALRGAYGSAPFTLPMIKVMSRDQMSYESGYKALGELLKKRGATPQSIDLDAQRLLIQYSGGHVRDLLGSLREAISFTRGDRVNLQAARSALGQIVTSLNVGKSQWERLAALERDPDRKLDPEDPVCARILEQLFALEYINGGEGLNFLAEEDPWYAVHPLLTELSSFKTALTNYDAAHKMP